MNKTPIAIALERQIPEYVREEYATFVQFVKAYYEFLEQTQMRDLEDIRSLDNTLDEFVYKFKKELSALFPSSSLEDERFILKRIREFYKARGSEESFKFLFRAFFNKDAEIFYPSKQILRASAGQWIQEKSIFVKANSGKELFDLSGKIITIIAARKQIDVYSPRVRLYRDGIYEVFIDRAYTTDIAIDEDVQLNGVSYGTIMPCPSKYTIVRKGSGFSVGSIYNLPSTSGDGSIVKITKVNNTGGIEKIQIISFGLDYKTTFFAKLSNNYYQPLEYYHPLSAATIGAGHPAGYFPTSSFTRSSGFYGDTTTGYMDYGYVIRNDYFAYQSDYTGSDNTIDLDPYFGDGTYVGQIIGEFYTNALNGEVIDDTIAEIQIDLGAVAIYPGYYNSTDGFISDEIYIQDGEYYQLYSYVIKVEQQLDSYIDMVKALLHPAGFEVFAQYNIKNDFIVSTVPLDAFVRYQFFDRVFFSDNNHATYNIRKLYDSGTGFDSGDNQLTIDKIAPVGSPTIISKYSALYSVDSEGVATLGTPSGVPDYLSDYGRPFEVNRNIATNTNKNSWNIVLGNQDSNLGTVSPLVNSTTTLSSNFENRTQGAVDTYSIFKDKINSPTTPVEVLAPAGSPTDYKKYSVLLTVAADGSTTIGTKTGIDAALSEYPKPVETFVGGAFGSVSGLEWDFRGDTWRDSTSTIAYHSKSLSEAVVSGVPVPYDFKDRTFNLYSELLNVAADGSTTIGTATGTNGVYSKYVVAQDYFDRSDANSSTVTYDRSIIPLEQVNLNPIDVFSPVGSPREFVRTGVAEFATPSELIKDFTFGKYKQPQLLGFTATLTAGTKDVTLTAGVNVNTMIGLGAIKISGTGAFGKTGTYSFDTGGDYTTAQSRYPQYQSLVTGGGGIFTSPSTSINVFGNNTPTLASYGIEFNTSTISLRSTDGKRKILIVSDTWRYSVAQGSSSVALSPYRVIDIPADGSYVSGGSFGGITSIPVYGYAVVSVLNDAKDALVESVDLVDRTKLTMNANHLTSGSITFYIEASSTEPEIADLAGTATPVHSGLSWDFSGATFAKTITSAESLDRTVTYDRSTIPLEQVSVTPSHSGLGWDLTPYSASYAVNYATISESINQKAIEKGTSAEPITDSSTPAHGGMNWDLSGQTFYESSSALGLGTNLNFGIGSNDFTFTSLAVSALLRLSINGTPIDSAQDTMINFFKTTEVTNTTVYAANAPSTPTFGYKYGDLTEDGTIGSIDALTLAYYVNRNYGAISASSISKIQRLLGKLAQYPYGTLYTLISAGYITANTNLDVTKSAGDNINIPSNGTVYFNPYNIETDGTVYGYNEGSTYFASDTRTFT